MGINHGSHNNLMTQAEIQNYYAGLLIIQYRGKPKAVSTIKLIVNQSLCEGLPQQEQTCFDLDTCNGSQLDIIGRIVGIPRNIYGLDLQHTFFQFTRYSGTPASVGFGRFADAPYSADLFLRYRSNATYVITDFEMRTLIKMKILTNNSYSSFANLINGMWVIFNNSVAITDTSLTLTYNVKQPYYNVFSVAQFLNIVPKPMGMALVINQV